MHPPPSSIIRVRDHYKAKDGNALIKVIKVTSTKEEYGRQKSRRLLLLAILRSTATILFNLVQRQGNGALKPQGLGNLGGRSLYDAS